MNAAIFASAFHPHLGGVEELCRQLALEQQRRGGRPLIVTNRWPKSLPAEEQVDGLPVRRFVFRVPVLGVRQWLGGTLLAPPTTVAAARAVRRAAAAIVHVQCVSSTAYYAMRVARRLRLPLVVSLQGELTMDAGRIFQRFEFARRLMRDALGSADAITACSRQTLEEARAFFGRDFAAPSRVVYNGIRLADFAGAAPRASDRPYVFAIGRHVPQKGFDVLLRAFAAAGHVGHDLAIAGDGPEHASLRALADELGVASRVRWAGRVDHAEAVRWFAGASLFVLPSRHEPMGIVNLEAMACGLPVIASRVGGVPELVRDGEEGLLVPAEDVAALAAALRRLCGEEALRRRLGEAGRARARQFDWSGLCDEYEQVYAEAIEHARRRGGAGRC